tara:strand:- start:50337 stop:50456 length:120 start_codon:yes stop_codon:yes gene_type:complete
MIFTAKNSLIPLIITKSVFALKYYLTTTFSFVDIIFFVT